MTKNNGKQPVVIKTIKAYPIPVQMIGRGGTIMCRIIKLGTTGFLVETENFPLVVNETYDVKFFVPMDDHQIEENCVVVKTYDQHAGKDGDKSKIYRMNELSFRALKGANRAVIERFLRKTKQA